MLKSLASPSARSSTITDDRRSVISGNSSNASTLVPESTGTPSRNASSQLRKFTANLGRPGLAKEAREAARNIISAQNPARIAPIAEPVDYENFISARTIQLENDPQRDLLLFPRDDVEEVQVQPESSTLISQIPTEIPSQMWLLTKEALELFSSSHHTVCFNYAKFAGDYNKITYGSSVENDATLASLVFESDIAAEEERAKKEGIILNDTVKEGFMMIVKNDSSILDNLKQAKKRFCILRCTAGGEIVFEVRKTAEEPSKIPPMRVNSAQIRSTKKGKTLLEIKAPLDEDEKSQKSVSITSDNGDDINSWLLSVNTAVALASKGDSDSSCSVRLERTNDRPTDQSMDSESIASEDSVSSREQNVWRGRNQAAKALNPPIVDRRNVFSLFHSLTPVQDVVGHRSCVIGRSRLSRKASKSSRSPSDRQRVSFNVQPKRFCVTCEAANLKLPIGGNSPVQVEPFFLSIFIFDAHSGRRLSEEYHSEVPSDVLPRRQLSTREGSSNGKALAEYTTLVKSQLAKAIFTVVRPHRDIWLVFRMDRCLSADTIGDLYMKSNPDPKAVVKMQKAIQVSSARLSQYRQRFAWAAKPLFEELRSDATATNSSKDLPLYRCENNRLTDTDLQRILVDFSKFEKNTKLAIPSATISFKLDRGVNLTDFPCRFNSSYLPLKPWKTPSEVSATIEPALEIQSFGDFIMEPHQELINLLYVYPMSLKYDNQKIFSKARNIACSVRFVSGDDKVANKAVFNRSAPGGPFVPRATCAVQHHQQCPNFGDEIKVQLPLILSSSDHLLFSFSHIAVAGNAGVKSPESPDTPIGYAWLPLVWKRDRLVMEVDEQEFALPIAAELPSGYLRSKPFGLGKQHDEIAEIRWVDQRPLFRVRLRLVSSAFTTEGKLQSFFQACQRLESKGIVGDATDRVGLRSSKSSSPCEVSMREIDEKDPVRSCSPLARSVSLRDEDICVSELIKRAASLCEIEIQKIIPFLPVILRRLLFLLPQSPTEPLALSTLSAIISIVDRTSAEGKRNLLSSFVRLHFKTSGEGDRSTHAALCTYIPALMKFVQNSNDQLASVLRHSWFLFDVICKSMTQAVVGTSRVKAPRRDRFPDILEDIGKTVENVTNTLILKHKELPEECRIANTALAFFLRCSLSLVDRGEVFKWIHSVVGMYDGEPSKVLRDYKADLLTVLTQHEHWLPLNLPVLLDHRDQIVRIIYESSAQDVTPGGGASAFSRFFTNLFQSSSGAASEYTDSDRYAHCIDEWKLSSNYSRRHFLAGILLQELKACIRETRDYRKRPIQILRNLMAKHSMDSRYTDQNMQYRLAILYAPFLNFAMDLLHELRTAVYDSNEMAAVKSQSKTLSLDRRNIPIADESNELNVLSPQPPPPPLPERLNLDDVRDILIVALAIIQRLPRRILSSIWSENDYSRALTFLQLTEVIADVFSYKGKDEALAVSRTGRASKGSTLSSGIGMGDFSFSSFDQSRIFEDDSAAPLPFAVLQVLNLSQEVALILLEALQTFSRNFATRYAKIPNEEKSRSILLRLLAGHVEFLEEHWPEAVRLHAVASLAVFVNLYRAVLFDGGPLSALTLLMERVLLIMASRLTSIQNAAAALVELILRLGYETAQSQLANQAMALSVLPSSASNDVRRHLSLAERLGRPGAQTGVALARLLGAKAALSSSGRFEKGLAALESLVRTETRKITIFEKAVLELIRQLRGVLVATVALKEAANDPIRLADLHLQLADSYRGSAALRCAWFDTLAQLHASDRWFSESAVCHAHSVAIIAKELSDRGELKLDWGAFDWISKEIAEQERGLSRECNVQPAGFTLENLCSKIEKTAQVLILAERFEAIGPLYRILIPCLEKVGNFTALVGIYVELQQSYSRAAEVKLSGKRHLGAYFRVRFFGKTAFCSDHDTEWVYREAGLTTLAEMKNRFELQCCMNGLEKVVITGETETNLAGAGDNEIAYIQVTHVEPQLEEGVNQKDFSVHTNLRKFVYESSFVVDGTPNDKSAPISAQALKLVSLEVTGHFPSSRRRLRIVSSSSHELSPLQFACQQLTVKAEKIRAIINAPIEGRALDVKVLQMLLQGTILPTVNAGPLAYAEAFTQPDQKQKYGVDGISDLKTAFRNLMSACESGLDTYQSVASIDQQKLQQVLTSSFEAMHERLQTFFEESLRVTVEEDKRLPRTPIHVLDSISGLHLSTSMISSP